MCTRPHAPTLVLSAAILTSISSAAIAAELSGSSAAVLSSRGASRAAAVSGPVIEVLPGSLQFGTVRVGDSRVVDLTFRNAGDEALEIHEIVVGDEQITMDLGVPQVLQPGDTRISHVTFTPTGGSLDARISVHSNATIGTFVLGVFGYGNAPPVIAPIVLGSIVALVPLSFAVTATDADFDPLVYSAEGVPSGASFDPVSRLFAWTPALTDEGLHEVTFSVSDGNFTVIRVVSIDVLVLNHPPVAAPGGPYAAPAGVPIQFDGSASSDPDGDALSLDWEFGDGSSSSQESPTHAYAVGSLYTVTLTVTDAGYGSLSHTAHTTADIVPVPHVLRYAQTWDVPGDLAGWRASTIFTEVSVANEGGNPGGYIRSYSFTSNTLGIVAQFLPLATGDFVAGRVTRATFDVKRTAGTFNQIYFRVRRSFSENGWWYSLPPTMPFETWQSFQVDFDPTWSDTDAQAAGWMPVLPTSGFRETMANAIHTEVRIPTGFTPVEAGIDNFKLFSDGVLNLRPLAVPGGPYTGAAGEPVQFNASASSDPEGNFLTYDWDFGDESAGVGVTPVHTYEVGGVYTVTLTVTDDGFGALSHTAATTAKVSGVQRCGAKRPHRVLVDSSQDGGVWWFPQGTQGCCDPCALHQAKGIADFLRSTGLEVHELPRPFVITAALLAGYEFVIRFSETGSYSQAEIAAYTTYVANGGRVLLLGRAQHGGIDALAEAFGVSFRGRFLTPLLLTEFGPHAITNGVESLTLRNTSGVYQMPVGATVLARLPDDEYIDLDEDGIQDVDEPSGVPVMGVAPHGLGDVVFMGSAYTMIFAPVRLWENLVRFLWVRDVLVDFDPDVLNLGSAGRWVTANVVPMEELAAADLDLSSVRLEGLAPVAEKAAIVTDHDGDGIPGVALKFNRDEVAAMLAVGENTLRITGTLLTGQRFEGADRVRALAPGGGQLTTSIAPNPLNPVGVLTIETPRPGPLRVRLFDLRGRLVRTVTEKPFAQAGTHQVPIDGRDESGRTLPSGIFFFRVEASGSTSTGRLTILK